MRSAMEILRLGGADADNLDRVLPIMERQMHQLSRMVDDLIDASRVSRGKVVLQQAHEDLTEILREAADAARITADFGDRQIELVLSDHSLPIRADRVRLTQVFGNLLTNAAKFTGDHGRIVIAARRFGDQVRVAVRDDGIGIERHLLDGVFELFTQANPGGTSGLGIGLALVRSLIRSHGGTVEVHSDGPGRGSEFVVSLPLADAARPVPIR
jgi:signal transduction histidine kinase